MGGKPPPALLTFLLLPSPNNHVYTRQKEKQKETPFSGSSLVQSELHKGKKQQVR